MSYIKELIIFDYTENTLSNSEISKKYNIHRTTVQRILKSKGIVLRKKTSGIKVNHRFFSNYTSKSCYWAGFILADGYIRSDKRFTLEIKLQKKDENHLDKLKSDLEFEGCVKDRIDYVNLSISSFDIISDLERNFDIETKKSLTCFISDKIPLEFIKDFIRGYFDGDGCITFTSTNTINILGTYLTVNKIREFFFENGVLLRSKKKPDIIQTGKIYQINYSGKIASKCLKILYNGADTFMDRKFELYLKTQ